MNPSILAASLVALILSVLIIRRFWLTACVEEYGFNALYYCQRKQLSVVTADEMSRLWPGHLMLFEVWHWDFSRYVIHQDHLEAMNAFISTEMERKDLDLSQLNRENDENSNQPPTDSTPP